ncbi:MAG: fibronectin type III domain-containing protein [Candidatus Pacebacteria bacterium]|nr:fibronectin type III domain-containing protein [Candidatus Paceibacterota bacterium]
MLSSTTKNITGLIFVLVIIFIVSFNVVKAQECHVEQEIFTSPSCSLCPVGTIVCEQESISIPYGGCLDNNFVIPDPPTIENPKCTRCYDGFPYMGANVLAEYCDQWCGTYSEGATCSNGRCVYINYDSGKCPSPCHPGGTYCDPISDVCCSPYTCITNSCQCTPCPDPSTYCPGQTVFDGCGNVCSAPGTAICDPGPPTNFNHSANTINSISWTWTKPETNIGYYGVPTKYQIFNSSGNLVIDNIPTTACLGSACSWQETSLSPNSQYARYVKACNQSVCSAPSNTASAYTSIQPVVSAQCSSITPNSIQITAYSTDGLGFSNLTSDSSGILFQRTGFSAGYIQSASYNFTGLTASTNYTFTTGPSKNGDSENNGSSVQVDCSTQAPLPIPNAPSNLHHTANTANTIDWAWNASLGATYYNVYIKYYSNGNPYWILKTNTTAITYQQTDSYHPSYAPPYDWLALDQNTMYGLGVSACNVNGCSGLSLADGATSMLAPSALVCSNQTQTSMTVQAVGPFVNLTVGSSGIIFRESSVGYSQDSQSVYWYLLGLTPNTAYTFYAKSRNQEGDLSSETGPVNCSTLPVPEPPIVYSLRAYGPGGSILKLALISVADALSWNKGTIKTRMPNGTDKAAFLVETNDPNASPVRVMTPLGIKAWRKAP